jgi:hypothetical protein
MKVLVIESSYPKDFYSQKLDGPATHQLMKLLGALPELSYALDRKHFKAAIKFATSKRFKVLHLSCHGDEKSIALTNNSTITWPTLAEYFQDGEYCPDALVMSTCCGGAAGIAEAFARKKKGPKIIFGSTDERSYGQYAVAWAILYRRFMLSGVHRDAAQKALRQICAVVHPSFIYRRWDDDDRKYRFFPAANVRYEVREIEGDEQA